MNPNHVTAACGKQTDRFISTPSAQRDPEIPERMSLLESELSMLGEDLERLFVRLTPVMCPPSPEATDTCGEGPSNTQIGGQLQGLYSRVSRMRRHVMDVTSRLEV